jgi:hypothetical protein
LPLSPEPNTIHPTPNHSISSTSILILSIHILVQSDPLPSGFPAPVHAICPD